MLLPSGDADQRIVTTEPEGAPGALTIVHIPLRNAGKGPAVSVAMAIETVSGNPWLATTVVSAIAAGDEVEVRVPVFGQPGEALPFLTFYAEYQDLGGVRYATKMNLNLAPNAFQQTVSGVELFEGHAVFRPTFPSLKPNLTRYRRPPLRPRLRRAAGVLFLEPGEPIGPLRRRIRAAWREIRPAKRQTIIQRLRWAVRADRANRGSPGPYDIQASPGIRGRLRRWHFVARARSSV